MATELLAPQIKVYCTEFEPGQLQGDGLAVVAAKIVFLLGSNQGQ